MNSTFAIEKRDSQPNTYRDTTMILIDDTIEKELMTKRAEHKINQIKNSH